MNHETKINNQGIYKCLACGNEIIVPIDESAGAKQEFVDECPKCSHTNGVHIKINGGSNVHVWVKGHSHDEQKDLTAFGSVGQRLFECRGVGRKSQEECPSRFLTS